MNYPTEAKTAYVYKWHPAELPKDIDIFEIQVYLYDNGETYKLYKNVNEKTLIPGIGEYFIRSDYIEKVFIESDSSHYVMYLFEKGKEKRFLELIMEHYRSHIEDLSARIAACHDSINKIQEYKDKFN